MMAGTTRAWWWSVGALFVSAILILVLWAAEGPRAFPVAVQLVAYVPFLIACRATPPGARPYLTLAVAALLLRLPLALATPVYSDDVYRMIWEGRVQVAGGNPFALPPDAPELRALDGDGLAARVNHPHLAAIYPPAAQMTFAALAFVGADRDVRLFKLGLVGLEALAALAIARWLMRRRRDARALQFYLLNPLVVVEIAGHGHLEVLVIGFVALALWATLTRRPLVAGVGLGAAIAAKLLPLVLLPALVVRRGAATIVAAAAATLLLLYLPYAGAGGALVDSLSVYSLKWQRNGPLFPTIDRAIVASGLDERLDRATWDDTPGDRFWRAALGFHPEARHSAQLAKRIAGALFALLAAAIVGRAIRRRRAGRDSAPEGPMLVLALAALALSPILYPWYLLLLLPMAILHPAPALHWLFATAPLMYLSEDFAAGGALLSEPLTTALVWAPAAALALRAWRRGPRRAPKSC